jgi:glycosyltransferase involved in cell wall biosynthesis
MAIVGDLGRDPSEVALLRASLAHHGLEQRVTLLGAVSDAALEAHYAEADIFVSASFHEGYGMAVARALAHGLPIVSTNSGALADTIPPGASVVCAAGDAVALRDAIARLRGDHDLRRHCAEMSWHAGQALPGWDITATTIAAVLRACGSGQV